ncbi:PIN domain-containing protein [Pseudonocardia phyllosphaerae]|uniref:PIN domain-containing protein n=1 Tax=Pseudonocardia phyllosphaerae TaxID=3390502 RepID=UPI00397C0743
MTSSVPANLVVVDTDVFSRALVARRPAPEVKDRLLGKILVIPTHTRAELLLWPRVRNWGPTRSEELLAVIDSVATVPVTDDVVAAYVDLRVACQARGHALAAKVHSSDCWIAATAIALDRPLCSLDGVYRDAPGLELT